jgi:DNA-directed RNA polymerase beta subunit
LNPSFQNFKKKTLMNLGSSQNQSPLEPLDFFKGGGGAHEEVKQKESKEVSFTEPNSLTEDCIRDILVANFHKYSRVKHQLDSMNQFMFQMLPSIVGENAVTVIKSKKWKRCHVIHFGTVVMRKPTVKTPSGCVRPILPSECRKRGLTYSSDVFVDVTHEIYDNSTLDAALSEENELRVAGEVVQCGDVQYGKLLSRKVYREILLCEIPVMLQSGMCHLPEKMDPVLCDEDMCDSGGYFVVNGNEKTIITQVVLRNNFPFVVKEKRNQRYAVTTEIRSLCEKKIRSTSTLYLKITRVKKDKMPQVLLLVPFIKYPIPLCAVFRLIGVEDPRRMFQYIMDENKQPEMEFLVAGVLRDRPRDNYMDCSIDDLCDKIGKKGTMENTRDKRLRYVKHIFHNEFFPHMGLDRNDATRAVKARYLGYCVLKMLLVFKDKIKEDDRDHVSNKKLLTPGMLCGLQFRQQWRLFLKSLNISVHRAIDNGKFFNINDMINPKRITSGFKYALSTGNWGQSKGGTTMKGVAQMLPRMTPLAALSHLRRINTPLNREGKAPEPRQLQPSFAFLCCPVETPEGAPCGLINNLALSCIIRIGSSSLPVVKLVNDSRMVLPLLECQKTPHFQSWCKVMINGMWLGMTQTPLELREMLRTARQYQDIPFDTSIVYIHDPNKHQLILSTESGALLHPVLVVDKLHLIPELRKHYRHVPTVFWDMLMTEGIIEFMDKEEEETTRVAMRASDLQSTSQGVPCTHLQIHPSLLFGVGASIIPLSNHNQAPRNMYQCIDADEPIRMSDWSTKRLGDVAIGDSVVTFDPQTLSQSTSLVTHAFTRTTDKKMVRVTTTSGRTIQVTDDHLFMTDKGWMAPKDFIPNDTMLALSDEPTQVVWIPVQSIRDIASILIADITTESAHHCFITASGFHVHNSSMGKQAIGAPATNFLSRPDSKQQILDYPQRPIVSTFASRLLGNDDLPPIMNVKVGIGIYTGYNQEDSVILNQASVDRGLFRSTCYQTFKDIEKSEGTMDHDKFEKPDKDKTLGMQCANYQLLNPSDGLPDIGVKVVDNDAIIGKVMISGGSGNQRKASKAEAVIRDRSTLWKSIETGVVDEVLLSSGVMKEDMRTVKVRVRSQRVPQIGDKFCMDEKHDVLTEKRGWVPIAQVTLEDKVACSVDGKLEYQHPTELHEFDCEDEELYHIANQGVDLCVTKNHQMWVKRRDKDYYELIEAQKLFGKRVQYKKNAQWLEGDIVFQPPGCIDPEDKWDTNAWLTFFGIWIAEGWARYDEVRHSYRVTIAAHKPRVQKALKACMKKLPFGGAFYEKPQVGNVPNVYYGFSHRLAKYLKQFSPSGSTTKFLPDWVWQLSQQQSRILLEGMLLGDGSTTNSGSLLYYTSSIRLVHDVQKLCVHCGWSSSFAKVYDAGHTSTMWNGQTITSTVDAWRVGINRNKCEPRVNHSHSRQQGFQVEEYIKYTGKVYCLTVPSHVFMVRRNGKPVLTGNSSRHGQKGVVGLFLPPEDMPYTMDGTALDLIINPHCCPSRMTIAHLMEMLLGKVCALEGQIGDGTPFRYTSVEQIADLMAKFPQYGDRYGNETVYSGITGEQMTDKMFIGIISYQRLKHQPVDKVHGRSRGPKQLLTRQPNEGRARDGGLRFGEMERDMTISHGAAHVLEDRMFLQSDRFDTVVCTKCGLLAERGRTQNVKRYSYVVSQTEDHYCRVCKTGEYVREIEIPYAFKLFVQEMAGCHIGMRLNVDSKE